MTTHAIDTLGQKLGEAALTFLVHLYPDVRQASDAQLDAACAAMRAEARTAVDEFLDDASAAPTVAHLVFQSTVLSIAHAGIKVLKCE